MQKIAIILEEHENEQPNDKLCYVNSKDLLFGGAFRAFYYPRIRSLAEAIEFCKVSNNDTKQQRAWIFFIVKGKWKLMAET